MLRIDRVEIHGFKSFCDRTEVRINEGITAVVGPNGCGKSNIGDAIHWVLGERSARVLRGGSMEDVIFAGTESRGPHGLAEVSLHFRAMNGELPGGEPVAVVTRRLFRSGDSEYLINGRKVRLRDIEDMLHAARVGATTYAVIEQGKVDSILSAKPRERRFLIEEAAGVIGYKQKRRHAEIKLEATEANLLRIHDIVLEVNRQINSLKRQAARARRFTRVRDELRAIEARLIAARARTLQTDAERTKTALADVHVREAEESARVGRSEAELEATRQEKRETETAAAAAREEMHGLAREIDREESLIGEETRREEQAREEAARVEIESQDASVRLDQAMADASARGQALAAIEAEIGELARALKEIGEEEAACRHRSELFESSIEARRAEQFSGASRLAEIANTAVHLEKEIQRLAAQAARTERELAQAQSEAASLTEGATGAESAGAAAQQDADRARAAAEDARQRLRALDERSRALGETVAVRRESLARLEERVLSLESLEARLAGVGSGARWLLTRNGGTSVRGLVADFVRAEAESESAVEGYLGPLLSAVVVPSSESAATLVGELSAARAGRCVFVPEGTAAPETPEPGLPAELSAAEGVLGLLSAHTAVTNGIGGLLARKLRGAVLVRDLRAAIDLSRVHPERDFVTPAGDVVARDGTIEGGRGGGSEEGMLARRRLLETARSERASAAEALWSGEEERRVAQAGLAEATEHLAARERELQDAEKAAALAGERAGALAAESERASRRAAIVLEELGRIGEESREIAERVTQVAVEKEQLERELAVLAESIQLDRGELESLQAEASARAERLAGVRQGHAAVRERRNHVAAEFERLETEVRILGEKLEGFSVRRAEALARGEAAREAVQEARERLARRLALHAEATRTLAGLEERIARCEETAAALEERAREERVSLESVRERRRGIEVEAAAAEMEWRHLGEKCRESLQEELDSLLDRVPAEPDLDPGTLEAEAATLRGKLEAIGNVNLLAIEEFRTLEERHTFLLAQEKDLRDSIESLKETIKRINRTSRELFLEAFERIRGNFNDTFRLLFGGGRADIRLLEDEDPLECGLDITAQPPGKRLQSLSLLSGGERALSAIALLFAIFRYQPSPFCLLDEVDAALDELNVRRFTRMLREFSADTQFIVITHNKRSMEAANTLYGVTMEEPGISRIVSMTLSQ